MHLLFVLVALIALVQAKDFYKILEVDRDADEKTIKQAYRRLSKQYHPDKNSDDGAHDRFIEIGEAYDVLSNKESKEKYDKYGDANAPDHNGFGGFGDMFSQFFNGGGPGGQRGKRQGESTQTTLTMSLKDFYTGNEISFAVQMQNLCPKCDGTGSKDKERTKCSKCHGSGIMQIKRQLAPGMFQTFQTHCDQCGGKGSTIAHKCDQCGGATVVLTKRDYDVYIPPGFGRGMKHVLQGEGNQNPDWVPGDLILIIQEDPNKNWGYRRIGNNLYRTEVLTLKESLEGGWSRTIPFFDSVDHEIELSRKPGQMVLNDEVEVVPHKGMPVLNEDDTFGDLFIEYKVLVGEPSPKHEKDEL